MKITKIIKSLSRSRPAEAKLSQEVERARIFLKQGDVHAAESICKKLLGALPDDYDSTCLFGEIRAKQGNAPEALQIFARAIALQPEQPFAYYKRGNLLRECDRWEESLRDYEKAIALNPSFAQAFCNRGAVLQHLKRFQEALDSCEKAIELEPTDALALFNRGAALRDLNRPIEALESYKQAILVKPDFAECHCNMGLLQAEMENEQAALTSYDRCIEINAEFVAAHFNRGVLLQAQRRWNHALVSYNRVIELNSEHADAYNNRAVVLMELRHSAAAMADFDRVIQLRPDSGVAYLNRGKLLAQMRRFENAVENYDIAIALNPDYADAFYNRADILLQSRRFTAAIESYDAAFRLDPNRPYLRGMRLHARMNLCDWNDVEAEIQRVIDVLEGDASISPPFPLLALVDRPDLHLKCARSWALNECSIPRSSDQSLKRKSRDKIRIGYFSGDFCIHPVSALMVGVIEHHDRSRFEIIAFSYGPNAQDDMRLRLEKAFDQFLNLGDGSDQDIATMARSLEIDVAVDLAGYTGNGRTRIFALRAAPIQVGYIGYLGTMGAPFMDYLIADPILIPVAEQQHYSEKIIYLPSYQANDSKRRASDTVYTRDQLGLPSDAFVFACFNANYKITPTTFSVWMRILARVQGSVLYLYADNQMAERNLRLEAERRDIDAGRIIFGEKLAFAEYLARYRVMDLFLDTLPYNAGTTASDALWAGLPVITCTGRAFAARVAASLLTAINMPELITSTVAQYEELAVKLAMNPNMMTKVREKLARNRLSTPLFDTDKFTRNLEAAYAEIVRRNDRNLEPNHINIAVAADLPERGLSDRDPLFPHV